MKLQIFLKRQWCHESRMHHCRLFYKTLQLTALLPQNDYD